MPIATLTRVNRVKLSDSFILFLLVLLDLWLKTRTTEREEQERIRESRFAIGFYRHFSIDSTQVLCK